MHTVTIRISIVLLLAVGAAQEAAGQVDYSSRLGLQQGDETSFAPQGPEVMLGVLDPAVRRWYVPQELYKEYHWRQWQYTNYARNPYQRYVDISLEGDYFYDLYGNFLTRGWLIFNNSQSKPPAVRQLAAQVQSLPTVVFRRGHRLRRQGPILLHLDDQRTDALGDLADGLFQAAHGRRAVRPRH